MPGGTITLIPSYGDSVEAIVMAAPDRGGGVGGWQGSERAARRPGKWFKAQPDDTYSWDLLFDQDALPAPSFPRMVPTGPVMVPAAASPFLNGDPFMAYSGFVPGTPIEERLARVRRMGVPHSGHDEPPTVRITGDVWDNDEALTWVVEDMGLGDRLFTEGGKLRQQHFSLSLSRYSPLDEIEEVSIQRTRGGKGGRRKRHRTVVTKAGDTLRAIALRELGSGSRWKDLRAWNKKKLAKVNPDTRLRAGLHLRVN